MPDYQKAKARIRIAYGLAAKESANFTDLGDALTEALDGAIAARDLIDEEQQKLREQPYVDGSDIEIAAREYLIDLVAWQLNRAADIAEERKRYFSGLRTPADIEAELAKCADGVEGTIHWFKYYAWGFDPRSDSPLQVQPFALFEFQERYIRWIERLTFHMRASGVLEKMRDAGATVGFINWTVKQWRFRDGFSALLTSATEDLIDSKSDPDTLFEKARFQIRLLPRWMLPGGFDLEKHLTYMNIPNPQNGSVITGAAPTRRVGRQRRRTVVLCDELASWPHGGYPQYTALAQTCKSIFGIATPEGRHNQYADWRHSQGANVFTVDWREHPFKDKRWYDALPHGHLGVPMSPEQIAQEIERNYDASQPGKVFKQWREEYCLITWEELIAFYKKHKLDRHFYKSDGTFGVPSDWRWARTSDYGQTDAHPWIVTWGAQPRANYPLSDTLFIFASHRIEPTGASVLEAQAQIEAVETQLGWRDRRGKITTPFAFSTNSHEQKDLRATFWKEHGERWVAWNTDYTLGIPQLQQWFELVDKRAQNPFREELTGRARIVFVAPPGEYKFLRDEALGRYFITPSKTEAGYKLLRKELPSYHYPEEEKGKAVRDMRPFKLMDDAIDTLRAFAVQWGPGVAPKTSEERIDEGMPAGLKSADIAEAIRGKTVTPGQQMMTYIHRETVKRRMGVETDDEGVERIPGQGVISLPDYYED